ncbi:hypothetical protein CRG98_031763 [Punica granatum]|uniref:Uncharacterized protein n=1 Tax=Punica granatum TaxID=22663 RepID=A0A2I0IUX3_PUNGR|nr:hypothetical protein CRG98_031763 [Punica granatum]
MHPSSTNTLPVAATIDDAAPPPSRPLRCYWTLSTTYSPSSSSPSRSPAPSSASGSSSAPSSPPSSPPSPPPLTGPVTPFSSPPFSPPSSPPSSSFIPSPSNALSLSDSSLTNSFPLSQERLIRTEPVAVTFVAFCIRAGSMHLQGEEDKGVGEVGENGKIVSVPTLASWTTEICARTGGDSQKNEGEEATWVDNLSPP